MNTLINTGKIINLNMGLLPEDITIESLAASLSKICRYNGHCNRFYSVAEHSIVAAKWALEVYKDKKIALACLLHDSAESYIGDIVTPFKKTIPNIDQIESDALKVIGNKFGVNIVDHNGELNPLVEEIDRLMFESEVNILMPEDSALKLPMPDMPNSVKSHFFNNHGGLNSEWDWTVAANNFSLYMLKLLNA